MKTTNIKAGHTGLARSEFPSNASAVDKIHDILTTKGIWSVCRQDQKFLNLFSNTTAYKKLFIHLETDRLDLFKRLHFLSQTFAVF
jgi:hypothetical protein